MRPEIVWSSKGASEHLEKLEDELKEKVDPVLAAHLVKLQSAWRRPQRLRSRPRNPKRPASEAA